MTENKQESRLKQFVISDELFLELFKAGAHPGYEVTDSAIPADARIVKVRHGWPNQVEILLTSQEFPELKSGDAIPYLAPVVPTIPMNDLQRALLEESIAIILAAY